MDNIANNGNVMVLMSCVIYQDNLSFVGIFSRKRAIFTKVIDRNLSNYCRKSYNCYKTEWFWKWKCSEWF